MRQPFLKGQRINVRPIMESDLQGNYWEWFNDSEVTHFMVKGAFPNTPIQQRQYYERVVGNASNLILAIEVTGTNEHIGNVGLHQIDTLHRTAEMGIVIGEKSYWSKGYATEAITLICDHGFNQLNLHRIELGVFAEHHAAIRSYEKIGFKNEGIKRQHIYKHGQYQDVLMMGMLRGELI